MRRHSALQHEKRHDKWAEEWAWTIIRAVREGQYATVVYNLLRCLW